jgi:hypothetical protein
MTSRLDYNTPQSLIDEYLARGGEITVCPTGERTEELEFANSFYRGRRKKSTTTNNDEE